ACKFRDLTHSLMWPLQTVLTSSNKSILRNHLHTLNRHIAYQYLQVNYNRYDIISRNSTGRTGESA
ncbi:hypothetical protein L9F63_010489, partial [Diploptera punctata]